MNGASGWALLRRGGLGLGMLLLALLAAGSIAIPAMGLDRGVIRDATQPVVLPAEQASPLSAYRTWFGDAEYDATLFTVALLALWRLPLSSAVAMPVLVVTLRLALGRWLPRTRPTTPTLAASGHHPWRRLLPAVTGLLTLVIALLLVSENRLAERFPKNGVVERWTVRTGPAGTPTATATATPVDVERVMTELQHAAPGTPEYNAAIQQALDTILADTHR